MDDIERRVNERIRPQINLCPSVYSLFDIVKKVYTLPDFQRGYVWSEDQAVAMIERMLGGLPIGSLLCWNKASEHVLLDGQHRMITLGASVFRNGKNVKGHVPLIDLDTLNVTCEPGSNRVTIAWILNFSRNFRASVAMRDPVMLTALELAQRLMPIKVHVMEISDWDATMADAINVYKCYNSGGTPIQEIP